MSTPKIIYAVRHCSATGQHPEAPLTEAGKIQSQQLAAFFEPLAIDRIVSSNFERAIESIRPIAERNRIQIEIDERLAERNLGSLPDDNWIHHLQKSFEDPEIVFPGGESTTDALARAKALADVIVGDPAERTLIITHGNLLTLFLRCFDKNFGFPEWKNLANPDVFQISQTNDSWTVTRIWNESPVD